MLVDKTTEAFRKLSEIREELATASTINELLDARYELSQFKEEFPALTDKLIKGIDKKLYKNGTCIL